MPFLLMVFLTLVCLPEPGQWPESPLGADTGLAAALTWSAVALHAFASWASAHRVRPALGRDPAARDPALHRLERDRFFLRLSLFGTFAAALELFGWGSAVGGLWRWPDGTLLPCAELVVLTPFLAGLFSSWCFAYDADKAVLAAAHRLYLAERGATAGGRAPEPVPVDPATPLGGRAAYVFFQFRQKLALVFIPLGLLVLQKDLRRQFPASWPGLEPWANAAGVFAVTLVLVGLPWVFRLSLGLRPIPPGPVRDRLLAAAARLRFRFSDLLLWNTRSGMANAMVIGMLPWPRYVVFTDRLLEEFTPEEVEAVLGHEIGHVKHYHMLYYFGFLSCSMMALWFSWQELSRLPGLDGLNRFFAGLHQQDLAEGVSIVVVLLGYIFVVFGFLSRRCERQADVFGCRAVSCGKSGCIGHEPGGPPPAGDGLCASGIRTFIGALDKVALVNGISRDRPGFLQSWQHSTIARRVEFLQRLLKDPGLEPRFQRRVAWVKAGLLAVVVSLLAALALA